MAGSSRVLSVAVALAVEVTLLAGALAAGGFTRAHGDAPARVRIADAPHAVTSPTGPGRYAFDCGTNRAGHRNTANVVVNPGVPGPEHHVHDYVGNVSTDVHSTDASLLAAGTTCGNGDPSTFYWPVLRSGGEHSEVLTATSVRMEYLSSASGPVVAPPRGLRAMVGDARAVTGGAFGVPTWTCAGAEERRTDRYPRCPAGRDVQRVFEFPSCWDGARTDSGNHRRHLTFPEPDGSCRHGTFAIPRLRITLGYPAGGDFTVDAFADQGRSARTDHGIMINLASEPLMAAIVACLNTGRSCRA